MSEIQDRESAQMLLENLQKAASIAHRLGRSTKSQLWTSIGNSLEQTKAYAKNMYNSPAPNRQDTLAMIDRLVDKQAIAPGSQTKQ